MYRQQVHVITAAVVWREEVPICHIASPVVLIVQYRMCVRCISDWLDETQRQNRTPPDIDTRTGNAAKKRIPFLILPP